MKIIYYLILIVFGLLIYGCSDKIDKTVPAINPTLNDRILKFDSILIEIYLMDTIVSSGLFKYLSSDFNQRKFIGKNTILEIGKKTAFEKTEIDNIFKKLDFDYSKFYENCIECGDTNFSMDSKNNILITKLYLLCKSDLFSDALRLLTEGTLGFNEISTIILLNEFGIDKIKNELEKYPKSETKIKLFNINYDLEKIRQKYEIDNLSFLEYFRNSNKRLEEFGI